MAEPSLWVVMDWRRASTEPVAELRWSTVPLPSPTAVTASPVVTPSVSGVTVASPEASASCRTATSFEASVPTTVAV